MGTNGAKPKHVRLRDERNRPPEGEPWAWLTKELLESEAWRTAPIWTIRFVFRLMVEHTAHAGTQNGNLICTFNDCATWGIRRNNIKDAQTDAIKRGLVYQSQKGRASAGRGRRPSRFGLGWIGGHDGSPAPNRWKAWRAPSFGRLTPSRRSGAPAQDIRSSTAVGTGRNGGNASSHLNKVSPLVLDKVSPSILGKNEYMPLPLNQRGLPPGGKYGKEADGKQVRILKHGQPEILNNLASARYDIRVSVGPSYTTQRQEAADAMLCTIRSAGIAVHAGRFRQEYGLARCR